jgi:acid phosphatase type 7
MFKSFGFLVFMCLGFNVWGQVINRGPYLQMGMRYSTQIKWSTDVGAYSIVKYGTSAVNLNMVAGDSALVTGHEVNVGGLMANTKYFYAIYGQNGLMEGTTNNFFVTQPEAFENDTIRIWAIGDCGTATINQARVINQMENYLNGKSLNAWILMGDNAYYPGYEAEYQNNFFIPYQNHALMKQTSIYPSPGNHDYANINVRRQDHNIPYFNIFSMPQNAEMGGVASGTEHYYSYDIGNVHLVSIDSYGYDGPNDAVLSDTTTSLQISWLKQDLAANTKDWTILYWHHPPYTMSSHNSDTEIDLQYLRQKVVPILEKYNVDLVLNGHSHGYERSKPMKAHYGYEQTFDAGLYNRSGSSGGYDGSPNSCPYIRHTNRQNDGILYVVAGSAGWRGTRQVNWPHNAMHYSNYAESGSMILEIIANKLEAKWVTEFGEIKDKFTMLKDNGIAIKNDTLVVASGINNVSLTASMKNNYRWWNNNAITQTNTIQKPRNGQLYHVSDALGCFTDQFLIQKSPDCLPTQIVSGLIEQGSNVNIKSLQTINADGVLQTGGKMLFDASKNINLLPGFRVETGGVFETKLVGCAN